MLFEIPPARRAGPVRTGRSAQVPDEMSNFFFVEL